MKFRNRIKRERKSKKLSFINGHLKLNKKHILIFLFAISLISMRLGYAILTQEINIDRTKNIYSDETLKISNIEVYSQTEESSVTNDVNYYNTISTFSICLNSKNDSITYLITIKNNSDKHFRYNGIESLSTTNSNIIYETDGIEINEVLPPHTTKTFKITFKYSNQVINYSNPYLETSIKINFIKK